jgi:hypothetical protein
MAENKIKNEPHIREMNEKTVSMSQAMKCSEELKGLNTPYLSSNPIFIFSFFDK